MNDADRLLDVSAKFAGEEKTRGGQTFNGLRRGELPGTLDVVDGLGLGRTGDGEDAETSISRAGLGVRGGGGVLDDPIHVRLAGTDPDLADDHVASGKDFFAGTHNQVLPLLGGLEAGERGGPLAIVAGGGGGFGRTELHADFGARMGLAEDGSVTGLQDGVVRKEGDELQFSGRNERGAAKHEGGEAG